MPGVVAPPPEGFWRVGRGDDPLGPVDYGPVNLGDSRAGNRFDSYTGRYSVLYFGTTLEVCFGETLARFRLDPRLRFIAEEWAEREFMKLGTVPADWRHRRTAVRVSPPADSRFFDVEDQANRELLFQQLGPALAMFGHADLDVAVVRGHDRRVTRLISEWVWQQQDPDGAYIFDGIRYVSRIHTDWECWAVFTDDVDLTEHERQPILKTDDALQVVARHYGLRVF